jgi:hypothetical protein
MYTCTHTQREKEIIFLKITDLYLTNEYFTHTVAQNKVLLAITVAKVTEFAKDKVPEFMHNARTHGGVEANSTLFYSWHQMKLLSDEHNTTNI